MLCYTVPTMTQDEALAILKTGVNVFLTGEPGAGKSYTVNAYVAWCRSHGIAVSVTASTGIAATHIGGMTIHSWSGIGIRQSLSEYDLRDMAQNDKLVKRIKNTQVLIIDEISMLDARMLTAVDRVCRAIREPFYPFGGMQVLLVGDFFQLPPVDREGPPHFAFSSPAWHDAAPVVCYLHEQHRQADADFLGTLAAIRSNSVTDGHREILAGRASSVREGMTRLYSHNADVDAMNAKELKKLPGETKTFVARNHGARPLVEAIVRGCLSPQKLELKVGAKVMFTKNDPEHMVVNGTLGTVTMFQKGTGFPIVQLASGRVVVAEPTEWSILDGAMPIASVTQVPLRLAWAMTVHKSQGMSLDAAYIDLSSAFTYGQGYVALSRVRSLEGLHIGGINETALLVDPVVLEKDAEFRENSRAASDRIAAMTQAELESAQNAFITRCGGSISEVFPSDVRRTTHDARRPSSDARRPKESKTTRWQKTFDLVASGKTIDQAAKERSRTIGTILDHLEGLHAEKPLNIDRIRHIFTGDRKDLVEIHVAMAVVGHEKLTPVFNKLKGKYGYDVLRIARLLYRDR